MTINKIHIIGAPGSGKSFLARRINQTCQHPHLDLDDIFWDKNIPNYTTKASIENRTADLENFLQNEKYIIEGVYYDWTQHSFDNADTIIYLDTDVYKRTYRIAKRYIKRKLGIEKGKSETIKSVFKLAKWNWTYDKKHIPQMKKALANRPNVITFKNSDKAYEYIMKNTREID